MAEQATTDAPKKKTEEVKNVTREFSVKLDVIDFANKAKQLGALQAELSTAEAKLDSAKGQFKSAEAVIKEASATLIRAIQTGREMRSFDCIQIHDFVRGIVYWQLPGTGEELGQRAMDATEKQAALPLVEKPPKDDKVSA